MLLLLFIVCLCDPGVMGVLVMCFCLFVVLLFDVVLCLSCVLWCFRCCCACCYCSDFRVFVFFLRVVFDEQKQKINNPSSSKIIVMLAPSFNMVAASVVQVVANK